MERVTVSVLFSDVKDYSELKEEQLEAYAEEVFPRVASLLKHYKGIIIEINTWGDGVLLVSRDTSSLAHFALELRDLYLNTRWRLLPNLNCRIGLHSGTVFIGKNPLHGRKGVVGTQINLTARVEPITPPGEVFATDTFMNLFKDTKDEKITCQYVGIQQLAKAFGTKQLYRLLYSGETKPPLTSTEIKEKGHEKTDWQAFTELDSLLRQKDSEISDLRSQLARTSRTLHYSSSFMQDVICYNQGEYAQYQFLAGELHKELSISPRDTGVLRAHCDTLEDFLNGTLERVVQHNFEYLSTQSLQVE